MWLTATQAAAHLGYKVQTIYNMKSRGLLPYHKFNGKGRPRFSSEELDEHLGLDARAEDILNENELRRRR